MKTFTKRFLSIFLMCMMVCTVFPFAVSAAVVECPNCFEMSSFSTDYEQWTDTYHVIRGYCDNCGEDIYQGTNAGVHKMSGGECTLCGYSDICYHDYTDIDWNGCEWEEYCEDCGEVLDYGIEHGSTYTEWDGCEWYEYCRDCDELMDYGDDHGYYTYTEWDGCEWYEYCDGCDELVDSGTDHGSYSYGAWEYYNSSRHYRLYACSDCGEGSYEYGYHSTTSEYSQYSSAQHKVGSYCSTCSSYIGSTTYESHDFSYGSWTNYSGSQHRRSVYCSDCGYSNYEYASHSLSYGSWTSTGSSQHRRTVSCSCGYSTTETASHNLTYGSWTKYSDTQHKRTVSCSTCSYSNTEYAGHSITTGNWTSISDTQHSRTGSCSCGYSGTETASHSFSYGDWESYSDSEHRRTASCSCGYSGYEYEDHEHTTETGTEPKDETQHNILYACECGYTAEEPEDHTFSYGDWESYDDSEHRRSKSCSCGYSGYDYEEHEHSTVAGVVPKDGEQHTVTYACDCGHTIEDTEAHNLEYDNWSAYSEYKHFREFYCDCGFIDNEYTDHYDDDGDGYCDVCDYRVLRFSVTVPALMTFVVSGDGEVYAAANAVIVNNSTYNVEVTSVTVTAGDNWTLVPYDSNMADEKVDSRMIGFSLNGAETSITGSSETLSMPYYWAIDRDESLPLEYDAVISATSEIYTEEQVLTVVFILNWGPR